MAALVFLQATAEELIFRGYLLQHLARLSRHWLVWAGLPSALFALLHWNPALGPREQWFYFAATFAFGLAAALTVRRTGSLATAIGMHWGSNVLAILVVADAGFLDEAALFVQRGGAAGGGLAAGLVAMAVLLSWLLSPLSPLPRDEPQGRGGSGGAGGSSA
jgi:membrane protease YdiL (CAAX protease family)